MTATKAPGPSRRHSAVADWPEEQSLRAHLQVFSRQHSARLIFAFFAVALVVRVAMGGWTWRDLIPPLVILAAEPLTEWVTHVFLLHFRPRTVAGRRIDPLAARKHRAHHADPRDMQLVFVPHQVVRVALPVGAVLAVLLTSSIRLAFTAMVAAYGMFLLYEWTHFLIHSKYRPRRWYFRSIWRAHRNHHFRNEKYWFGVTVNLGDVLLRTFPAKEDVPVSDTARTLGVEEEPTAA